jgi:predicted transport protein
LENYGRKELVQIEEYTIEHILPQNKNLSEEWKFMLGNDWESIQKKYLHTIGNLTLTGYNSELSDRPFIEKRNMKGGFKDSPIRLNKELAALDKWDVEEILARAGTLAEKAMQIWPFKVLSDEILEKYKEKEKVDNETTFTLENFSRFLKGDKLELFNHLRNRILNLDSSVKEEFKKLYIAYKNTTNFVDIIPHKTKLSLTLNLNFSELNDPKGLCRDVTGLGRWGNGNVEVGISNTAEIDDIMFLIKQAYNKHAELNGA